MTGRSPAGAAICCFAGSAGFAGFVSSVSEAGKGLNRKIKLSERSTSLQTKPAKPAIPANRCSDTASGGRPCGICGYLTFAIRLPCGGSVVRTCRGAGAGGTGLGGDLPCRSALDFPCHFEPPPRPIRLTAAARSAKARSPSVPVLVRPLDLDQWSVRYLCRRLVVSTTSRA